MIVIYNPAAGRRRANLLWRVLDMLVNNGMRLELVETQHAGHATGLAQDAVAQGERLIVAAGGDGTIAEVARGIIGSTARMGVIPLGTANVLANELDLPFAPRAVAAALAFGRTRTLWPGMAQLAAPGAGRLFVQMLGVGLDAQVVHNISHPLKNIMGRGAYVAQTLRELTRYSYVPVNMRVDGREMRAASAIVSKGRLYAGRYVLAPDARPSEPGFSLALFDRNGPFSAMMYGAALPLNLLSRAPGLRLMRASTVEFLGNEAVPAQADGDSAGCTPLTVTDAAGPIEVVVG